MTEHEQSVQYINEYIARARAAQAEFEKMTQEQVDLAVKTIGKVAFLIPMKKLVSPGLQSLLVS